MKKSTYIVIIIIAIVLVIVLLGLIGLGYYSRTNENSVVSTKFSKSTDDDLDVEEDSKNQVQNDVQMQNNSTISISNPTTSNKDDNEYNNVQNTNEETKNENLSIANQNNTVVNNDTQITTEEIYMSLLNNERKYISEDNREMSFSEYMSRYSGYNAKISYALMDFDRDNENEMVIFIEAYDGFYLTLNYENGKIYGFENVYRGMLGLKEDGTYMGSGGYNSHVILRTTFNKNIKNDEIVAEEDMGTYKVNGNVVSEKEYNEAYEREFESKKDVVFKVYTGNY